MPTLLDSGLFSFNTTFYLEEPMYLTHKTLITEHYSLREHLTSMSEMIPGMFAKPIKSV